MTADNINNPSCSTHDTSTSDIKYITLKDPSPPKHIKLLGKIKPITLKDPKPLRQEKLLGKIKSTIKRLERVLVSAKCDTSSLLHSAKQGEMVAVCSYGAWVKSVAADLNFERTPEVEGFLRKGSSNLPELVLTERGGEREVVVQVARSVRSQMVKLLSRDWELHPRPPPGRWVGKVKVVKRQDGFVLLQVRPGHSETRDSLMLLVDLDTEGGKCTGSFLVPHNKSMSYEASISPKGTRVLIKAVQGNTGRKACVLYTFKPTEDGPSSVAMSSVPSCLWKQQFCFSPQFGEDHVIAADEQSIKVLRLPDWEVVQTKTFTSQPALGSSVNISSSPCGRYLAVHYILPNEGKACVTVLHCPSLTVALQTAVPRPVTQTKGFPCFSRSGSCIAVQTRRGIRREVAVFKLRRPANPAK